MRRKDGVSGNGYSSRVVINTVNAREVWKGEDGNGRELLNVGSLSSINGAVMRRGTVVQKSKESQPDDTTIATMVGATKLATDLSYVQRVLRGCETVSFKSVRVSARW